jgi:hypothetical protein
MLSYVAEDLNRPIGPFPRPEVPTDGREVRATVREIPFAPAPTSTYASRPSRDHSGPITAPPATWRTRPVTRSAMYGPSGDPLHCMENARRRPSADQASSVGWYSPGPSVRNCVPSLPITERTLCRPRSFTWARLTLANASGRPFDEIAGQPSTRPLGVSLCSPPPIDTDCIDVTGRVPRAPR